jgi:hypothetical protein
MSWCLSGVEVIGHSDLVIMKFRDTDPCESRLVSKEDVNYKLCLQHILLGAIGITPRLHDGQEEWAISLGGCCVGKWLFSEWNVPLRFSKLLIKIRLLVDICTDFLLNLNKFMRLLHVMIVRRFQNHTHPYGSTQIFIRTRARTVLRIFPFILLAYLVTQIWNAFLRCILSVKLPCWVCHALVTSGWTESST